MHQPAGHRHREQGEGIRVDDKISTFPVQRQDVYLGPLVKSFVQAFPRGWVSQNTMCQDQGFAMTHCLPSTPIDAGNVLVWIVDMAKKVGTSGINLLVIDTGNKVKLWVDVG
jgi:hypothetical protein